MGNLLYLYIDIYNNNIKLSFIYIKILFLFSKFVIRLFYKYKIIFNEKYNS